MPLDKPPKPMRRLHSWRDYDELCSATFLQNKFIIKGDFTNGQLIQTEYSRVLPNNSVQLEFLNCSYDKRVGSLDFPNTHIAIAHERGHWKFTRADFAGLPIDGAGMPLAILRNSAHADVVVEFV